MSNEVLQSKLVTKLRTDATLVTLTSHIAADKRIAGAWPRTSRKTPFLAVTVRLGFGEVPEYPLITRYIVRLRAYGVTILEVTKIADRAKLLFAQRTSNSAFYDFSDSGIKVYQTAWRTRLEAKQVEYADGHVWEDENIIEIVADTSAVCP